MLARGGSSPDVRVFVVWAPNVPGDVRGAVDRRVLADSRVTNFWDEDGMASKWFSQNVRREAIDWDAYFLYGPRATWTRTPGRPLASGSPVFDARDELQSALREAGRPRAQ